MRTNENNIAFSRYRAGCAKQLEIDCCSKSLLITFLSYFLVNDNSMLSLYPFIIGVTNLPPDRAPPVPGNYSICAIESNTMTETKAYICGQNTQPGRYVIVQIPFADYALTICELQIFINQSSGTKYGTFNFLCIWQI